MRFGFPLSPLFSRAGSGRLLSRFGLVLLPCRVACPAGTGVWGLALSFGAGPPQRGLLPRPSRRIARVWGSPLPPLPLLVSLGGGVQAPSALRLPPLSGRLCSGALLFLSPLGSCGRAVSAPRVLLSPDPSALVSWPGRNLVPGLCAVVCPPGLAAVLLCTPWVRRTCPGGLCLVLPFSAGERIVEAQPTDKPINIRKNICQTAFP